MKIWVLYTKSNYGDMGPPDGVYSTKELAAAAAGQTYEPKDAAIIDLELDAPPLHGRG